MKLIRFGPAGQEKPGLVDAQGGIRDLSAYVKDISFRHLSMETIGLLKTVDPEALPMAPNNARIGPGIGDVDADAAVPAQEVGGVGVGGGVGGGLGSQD